jgi:hypothetical protein
MIVNAVLLLLRGGFEYFAKTGENPVRREWKTAMNSGFDATDGSGSWEVT